MAGAPDGQGNCHTFPFDMIDLCKEIGLKFKTTVIWDKGITLTDWHLRNNRMNENHEYVWVMEK